jgi:hypothetical protein
MGWRVASASRDPDEVDRASYLEIAQQRSDDHSDEKSIELMIESVMGGVSYTCKRTKITKYSSIKQQITRKVAAYLS